MRISHYIFLASIGVICSGATIAAQGIQVKVQAGAVQIRPKIQADFPLLAADVLEKLKLTNEQNTAYRKLETEYKEKTKAAQDKYQIDVKGLRDREQFKDSQDKLKADTKKAHDDSLGKLQAILTDDQKATLRQVQAQEPKVQPNPGVRPQPMGGAGIGQVLPPATQNRLQLTDEQKKQIADIQKDVEAKIMKVLTDEQKKTLEQMKKGPAVRPLPIQPNPRIQQIQPAPRNLLPVNPNKD